MADYSMLTDMAIRAIDSADGIEVNDMSVDFKNGDVNVQVDFTVQTGSNDE